MEGFSSRGGLAPPGDGHRGLPVIGKLAGEQLIHDHTQGIDIRALIGAAAPGLLGGYIVYAAQGLPGQGVAVGGHLGDAEIGHLHAAVPEDHDIVGLDVPVYHAPAVGMIQGLGDLGGEMQSLPPADLAPLGHIFLQGHAVDQFHDDIVQVSPGGDVIHGHDVGVAEHGDGLAFRLEPAAELFILLIVVLEDLHRHQPVQPVTQGLVYNGHSADADDFQQFIAIIQHLSNVLVIPIQLQAAPFPSGFAFGLLMLIRSIPPLLSRCPVHHGPGRSG